MKFLDQKEEVIDFELTSYGKYLLSVGKFKPEYFAFFDSDVLYDTQYGGFSEHQNSAIDRIKSVPRLEAQGLFHGAETEINKLTEIQRKDNATKEALQSTVDRNYSWVAPLGTISLDAKSPPAWDIRLKHGEITSSISYKESDYQTLKIPQITLKDIEYQTIIKKDLFDQDNRSDLGLFVKKFEDGSYVDVVEDFILLEIDELNTFQDDENFDIELFEVKSETKNSNDFEVLTPLYFSTIRESLVKNNILLDDVKKPEQFPLDTSCVEYFLEVLVDNEVENELVQTEFNRNLYDTNVKSIKEC